MKIFSNLIPLILFSILTISCQKNIQESGWYVKYVADKISKDVEDNTYYSVFLQLPTENKYPETEKFSCQQHFEEIYGPYKKGTVVSLVVDELHFDTFVVKLYISRDRKEWTLVKEGRNQIEYKLE